MAVRSLLNVSPMPSLASCHRCQGFVADPARACPHCEAAPPRWGRIARALSTAVLGAVSVVTLMACYGAMPSEYDCPSGDYAACDCQQYGICEDDCAGDDDCVQGEYCRPDVIEGGACEWSGTCSFDLECPAEMVCDVFRGTCVPGIRQGCDTHDACATPAERCDFDTRTCVPTSGCGGDQLGCAEGTACEASYGICVPCEGAACGTCVGEVLCADEPPTCADGSQPAIDDLGCFTGGCITDATCAAQACAALDEDACTTSADCNPVYGGVNCSNPDGDPCSGGGPCTCESFVYLDCVVAPTAEPGTEPPPG